MDGRRTVNPLALRPKRFDSFGFHHSEGCVMKVKVRHIKDKYRVCDCETGRIARTVNGRPVDGGGHAFKAKADRQCGYINGPEGDR